MCSHCVRTCFLRTEAVGRAIARPAVHGQSVYGVMYC
jgi:hypothetical protein